MASYAPSIQVGKDNNKDRIDSFIQKHLLPSLTRSQIAKLIAMNAVKCNTVIVTKPLHKIKTGETITIDQRKYQELMHSLNPNAAPSSTSSNAEQQQSEESMNSDGDASQATTSVESSTAAVQPEDLPIEVLYEDEDIAVVNKPSGMIVHPSGIRNRAGTLVNALLHRYGIDHLSTCGIEPEYYRPGIVHRLDKDTTGVMVIAKNDAAHKALQEQFASKSDEHSKLNRSYIALVHNHVKLHNQIIDLYIARHKTMPQKRMIVPQSSAFSVNPDDESDANGPKGPKRAITNCKVKELFTVGREKFSLVELKLATGRTHQIRVCMAHIEHPVVGDILYNPALKKKKNGNKRGKDTSILAQFDKDFANETQMLHAKTLGFVHPRTQQFMQFEAPSPPLFTKVLDTIRAGKKSQQE